MAAFSGSEPLIGEIAALRTFRVEESGLLLPMYADGAWYDGPNTAVCSPPSSRRRRSHRAPGSECECGFYAYADRAAARPMRQLHYVQTVVSCWGSVVAGTKGLRAEHARVDAIWLAPSAPAWLRVRVARRYPSAQLYADSDTMLAEHPLSRLPSYEPRSMCWCLTTALRAMLATALLVLGLLPRGVLEGSPVLKLAWVACLASVAAYTMCWLARGRGTERFAAALAGVSAVAWLFAPTLGLLGWVWRAPLLRLLVAVAGDWVITLWPRHFPVVRTSGTRTRISPQLR